MDEGGAPKALPLEEMLSGQLVVTGARSGSRMTVLWESGHREVADSIAGD